MSTLHLCGANTTLHLYLLFLFEARKRKYTKLIDKKRYYSIVNSELILWVIRLFQ